MKSAIIVVLSKKHPYGKVLYHFVPVARCSLCVLFILQETYVQSGCCTLIRCDLLTHFIHRKILVGINLKWMHPNYFVLVPPIFQMHPIFHLIKSQMIIISKIFCIYSSQPSMVHWLSSSIFAYWSSVRPSRYGNIRTSLHFYFP